MPDWVSLTESAFKICTDTFGEAIEYTSKGEEQSFQLHGLFRNDYLAVEQAGFDSIVSSGTPVVELDLRKIKSKVRAGDSIKVRSVNYVITEIKPNGISSETKLILRKL